MNRYSNYSTSQFQPLSLDEIMMIPMAKQANHDKLANDAAMLEQSDFNRLQGDDPISNQELDDYHNKVRKLSEDLYATGYNPHVANKLKELNKEYNQNMSATGKWGRRQSNYNAYNAYKDEIMKNKDWSQADMQKLAYLSGSNFKTDNEDGTFNNFQGKYAPDKVDINKFFDEAIKNVAAETNEKWIGKIKSLDDITTLYANEKIDKLEFDKIINAVGAQLNANRDIQEMLLFQNELDGSPMTEQEVLTHFNVSVDEKTGKETYTPLTEAGRLLYAKAYGAQYQKVSRDYIKDDNEVKLANIKQQLQDASDKRKAEAEGFTYSKGIGPDVPIFSNFNNEKEIRDKIKTLKTSKNPEDIATAQNLENQLITANEKFTKENAQDASKLDKLKQDLIARGFREDAVNAIAASLNYGKQGDVVFGADGSVVVTKESIDIHKKRRGLRDDVYRYSNLSKEDISMFREFANLNKKKDSFVKNDYYLETDQIYINFGEHPEKLTAVGKELQRVFNVNDFKINTMTVVDADGNAKTKMPSAKEASNLIMSASGYNSAPEFVSFTDGKGIAPNQMTFDVKSEDGSYKRLTFDVGNLRNGDGSFTTIGSMVDYMKRNGNGETQAELNALEIKDSMRNIIPMTDGNNDYSGSGFIENVISPSLINSYYNPSFNLQEKTGEVYYKTQGVDNSKVTYKDRAFNEKRYFVGVKNNGNGAERNITFNEALATTSNRQAVFDELITVVALNKYPKKDLYEAQAQVLSDITGKEKKYDISEYYNLPYSTSQANKTILLLK